MVESLAKTKNRVSKYSALCFNLVTSYGGMTEVMSFMTQLEQLKFQQLNKWWYTLGVSRIQTRVKVTARDLLFVQEELNFAFIDLESMQVKCRG